MSACHCRVFASCSLYMLLLLCCYCCPSANDAPHTHTPAHTPPRTHTHKVSRLPPDREITAKLAPTFTPHPNHIPLPHTQIKCSRDTANRQHFYMWWLRDADVAVAVVVTVDICRRLTDQKISIHLRRWCFWRAVNGEAEIARLPQSWERGLGVSRGRNGGWPLYGCVCVGCSVLSVTWVAAAAANVANIWNI